MIFHQSSVIALVSPMCNLNCENVPLTTCFPYLVVRNFYFDCPKYLSIVQTEI